MIWPKFIFLLVGVSSAAATTNNSAFTVLGAGWKPSVNAGLIAVQDAFSAANGGTLEPATCADVAAISPNQVAADEMTPFMRARAECAAACLIGGATLVAQRRMTDANQLTIVGGLPRNLFQNGLADQHSAPNRARRPMVAVWIAATKHSIKRIRVSDADGKIIFTRLSVGDFNSDGKSDVLFLIDYRSNGGSYKAFDMIAASLGTRRRQSEVVWHWDGSVCASKHLSRRGDY